MKNFIIFSILLLLTTLFALGAPLSNYNAEADFADGGISKRYSIGIATLPKNLATISGSEIDQSFKILAPIGFNVGYSQLQIQSPGWTTQFTFARFQNPGQNTVDSLLRGEGNLAYQIDSTFIFKAGVNVSRLLGSSRYVKNLRDTLNSHGLGYQLAVGAKLSPNLAPNLEICFSYAETNLPNLRGNNYRIIGPEMSLSVLL
jgi:hypothetical protein